MILAAVRPLPSMILLYPNTLQGLYTALIVCLNVISENGGSNLYPPDEFDTFSPKDIKQRVHGSKIVLISEQVGFIPLLGDIS